MTEARLELADPQQEVERIEAFIRERLERSGRRLGVIALSGGVDSALVATLAVRALGHERVVSQALPDDEGSAAADEEDAAQLAQELNITHRRISLAEPLGALHRALSQVGLMGNSAAWANVKPRLRMIVNYFVANSLDGLVLGTGNKSELLLGYFTKFGDGGVDLLPIGQLYKAQVRQMARHLHLPPAIIAKQPSAGLWPGQTDEEELGGSYEQIDLILHCLHDRRLSAEETIRELALDPTLVQRVAQMFRQSEHKRRMPLMPGAQQ
ncbi:MAG TPA: NAD+ synthase [Candidatus Fraserbacteria bacterium]|nr:NAD+ synthase [Candidatus Fraserbacteria bacterium]